MKKGVEFLLGTYRLVVSPLLHGILLWPGGCRFNPTCSAYGLEAIRQYGLAKGFMLLFKRLGRCHPWAAGGYDPLPCCHKAAARICDELHDSLTSR